MPILESPEAHGYWTRPGLSDFGSLTQQAIQGSLDAFAVEADPMGVRTYVLREQGPDTPAVGVLVRMALDQGVLTPGNAIIPEEAVHGGTVSPPYQVELTTQGGE